MATGDAHLAGMGDGRLFKPLESLASRSIRMTGSGKREIDSENS